MNRSLRWNAVVIASGAAVFLVTLLVFLHYRRNPVPCTGCGLPLTVLVAKVSIARGTSGRVIVAQGRYSTKFVGWSQIVKGALSDPYEIRNEVATRTISAGTPLTAAQFALRSPIYYPRGYPKSVPASQTPAEMSHQLGPPSFAADLAVAPGVWVDNSPSPAAIDLHVANGTLVGYCSAVRAFEAHNPNIHFTKMCWQGRFGRPRYSS